PQLTCTVEPRDRAAIRSHDLASGIASAAPLRVDHRWRELNRIEGSLLDGGEHLGPAKVGIRSGVAVRIPSGDGFLQHRRTQSYGLCQGWDRLSLLEPALRQLGAIVVAPVIEILRETPS